MRRTLALALVALTVAAGCGDDDTKTDAATTTSTPTSTTSAPLPTTSSTTSAGPELADASGTAEQWIQAIADGDDDGAIALTSSRSLDAVGGPDGFKEREIELAEGWGAWGRAGSKDVTLVPVPYPPGTAIVVLHGEVSQEGPPQESWAGLPVVATDEGDRVEPFGDLGAVEVTPPGGSTITPDQDFSSVTPAGSDVYFVIDDREAITPALSSVDGERITSSFSGGAPLPPGLHALTVVVANEEGVMARTFTYQVSG